MLMVLKREFTISKIRAAWYYSDLVRLKLCSFNKKKEKFFFYHFAMGLNLLKAFIVRWSDIECMNFDKLHGALSLIMLS